jgi:cytochrome c-type biogenesis protein CcmH/NrfG
MALLADALEVGKGDIDETVRLLEEAYRLDPLDVNVIAFLGRAYFYAGREAEALAHWDKTSSLAAFRTSAPPVAFVC